MYQKLILVLGRSVIITPPLEGTPYRVFGTYVFFWCLLIMTFMSILVPLKFNRLKQKVHIVEEHNVF